MKAQDLFSAVLHVRYYCADLDSEFVITGVSGNQAQGSFTIDDVTIPVTAYRHSGNANAATNIWFAGADVEPGEFAGGTGRYAAPDPATGVPASMQLGGAYPVNDAVLTFIGTYVRQV